MNFPSGNAAAPCLRRCPSSALTGCIFAAAFILICATPFPGAAQTSTNSHFAEARTNALALKPHQTVTTGQPPRSPAVFSPDTGTPPSAANSPALPATTLRRIRTTNDSTTLPPALFNPDPGAAFKPPPVPPQPLFYTNEITTPQPYNGPPIAPSLQLPRTNLVRQQLEYSQPTNAPPYGSEPLGENLQLPRPDTRQNLPIQFKYDYLDYPLSSQGIGYPPNSEPEPDRWRIGFVPWRRYTSGETETPYETPVTMLWRPYRQSLLKGDAPVIGQDIFLDLTASSETVFEGKRVPIASGISTSQAGEAEFYGRSDLITVINNFSFSLDLFKGDTSFQPVQWAIHLEPVYNVNYIQAHETGVVSPDPRGFSSNNSPPPNTGGITSPGQLPGLLNGELTGGPASLFGRPATTRTEDFLSLQQAFFELHLGDLSENYDFVATRIGNQAFNQDFRGFLFNDVNTGWRIFGNLDDNLYQYNLAAFDLREKNTDSDLNTFNSRGQQVLLANLYRQDLFWKGYTAEFSFLANLDQGGTHYDDNGFLVRPNPIGTVKAHNLQAYYLGWAGDGHIGPFNISHQFYEALGHDDFNDLAGRPVNINAQMAALELSYDRDWIRYKSSIFYASGDHKTTDGTATGFDTVIDNPNFTGGPFSYWVQQGFNFGGTDVNLKQPESLVPDLRSSKTEGQANFVNPGVLMLSVGTEMDVTPKLRNFFNINYIRFMETGPLETALLTDKIAHDLGWDVSIGFQYRPLLTDNIIISTGFGVLIPGQGYKDIYQTSTLSAPGFSSAPPGHVDDFLYSGIIAVTFTY